MRICIAADVFPQLSETFVLHQAERLRARGHDVSVLCNAVGAAPAPCPVRRRWGVLGRLQPGMETLSFRARDRARRALDRSDAGYLRGFDVILAHFGYEGARLAALLRSRPDMPPLVTIFHGHDVATVAHDSDREIYAELFATGAMHLAVNGRFRAALVGLGAPDHLTRTHRMGIDLAAFPFRPRDTARRPLEILSVCRLTEKKGMADALEAADRLYRKAPHLNWRWHIVGDGELFHSLRARHADLAARDRIAFLGAQPHDRVRDLIARAHLFLAPSVTATNGDAEGVPVSLMEAMASGAVPVSTFHSGIPELIEDGVSGLLAPERDPEALAERLRTALEAPEALGPMADAARARVASGFNLDRQIDALEDILASVAAAPGVAGRRGAA